MYLNLVNPREIFFVTMMVAVVVMMIVMVGVMVMIVMVGGDDNEICKCQRLSQLKIHV